MTDNARPFSGQQLQNSEFVKADMAQSRFDGCNLTGGWFFAVMTNVTFTDTNLESANFDDVNLKKTRFTNVNLSEVVIENANLSKASFQNVNLSKASIKDANLEGMTIDGVLVSDLFAAYHKGA